MHVLFACKDPSPLYKSSKTRDHLKLENLETLFLQSALKMPIKSVINQPAEIKYFDFDFYLWLLDFGTVYSYFNIQLCSYLMLEIKHFVSLKNGSLRFWTRVHFKREELSFPKFWGGEGGRLVDVDFFLGGEGGCLSKKR